MRKLRFLRPTAGRAPDTGKDKPSGKDRINALITVCKANWLALMSYLAFVGVTLIGVTDPDFFMPERQTQLPLIGVTIPTTLFFAIAPVLGFMLYAHLHFYLMRLWSALNRPDAPGSESIAPWLVADFAIGGRDGGVAAYPLQWLANRVVLGMIFLAGPIVLAGFWWRSLPKHDGWLTLFWCGLPLFGSLLVGMKSWLHLRGDSETFWRHYDRKACWAGVFVLILAVGWLRAVNIAHWSEDKSTVWPDWLTQAQLGGVVFVETPKDWLPRDEAERVFRRQWCKDRDRSPLICGDGPYSNADPVAYLPYQRMLWCGKTFEPSSAEAKSQSACDQHFADLDQEYIKDWQAARKIALSSLPERNLSGIDLRGAYLSSARLEGAYLVRTHLEEAWLGGAHLEGADLWEAHLEGAVLSSAHLEGANLWDANLEWARLQGAHLEWANLLITHLKWADLTAAHLEGADLTAAHLEGAALWRVDLSDVGIIQEQVDASFGDASVILPEGVNRPEHWPPWDLGNQFHNEWRDWLADPANYKPPPPPEEPPT